MSLFTYKLPVPTTSMVSHRMKRSTSNFARPWSLEASAMRQAPRVSYAGAPAEAEKETPGLDRALGGRPVGWGSQGGPSATEISVRLLRHDVVEYFSDETCARLG